MAAAASNAQPSQPVAAKNKLNSVEFDSIDKKKFGTLGPCFGVLKNLVVFPLWTAKTRIQMLQHSGAEAKYTGTIHLLKTVVKNEGFFNLWKGFPPALSQIATGFAFLSIFETFKVEFRKVNEKRNVFDPAGPYLDHARNMSCAFSAGVIISVIDVPLFVLIQRMQAAGMAGPPPKFRHLVADLYKSEGILGFYRGWHVSALSRGITNGIQWTLYMGFCNFYGGLANDFGFWKDGGAYRDASLQALSAVCARCLNCVITQPMDVLTTRLEVGSAAGGKGDINSTSLRVAARLLYSEHGFLGFYKGLVPRMAQLAPASIITMSYLEFVKRVSTKPVGAPDRGWFGGSYDLTPEEIAAKNAA